MRQQRLRRDYQLTTVLLAHGLSNLNPNQPPEEYLSSFKTFFESRGYAVILPVFPGQDNYVNAGVIKGLIDSLPPAEPVHVAGHSMGGLSVRYYA